MMLHNINQQSKWRTWRKYGTIWSWIHRRVCRTKSSSTTCCNPRDGAEKGCGSWLKQQKYQDRCSWTAVCNTCIQWAAENYNGQDPKVHDPTKVMYEHDGDANCPVKSLQLYLSKWNPNCEAFFKRPKSKYTPDGIWYENGPVGKNLLSAKMFKLSTEAVCSERYTNHCLRATATTVFSHAGFDGNDICAMTGHRSVDSLRNYATGPSMDQRNKMSTVLHNYGLSCTDVTEQTDCSSENAVAASTSHSSQAVTHTMPSVISEHATVPQSLSVHTNQNSQTAVKSLLSGNNFYDTVNFYMNNQS